MTVDGAEVIETHFLEQRARQHHALEMLFGAAREFPHRGHAPQDLLAAFAQRRVGLAGEHAREIIRHRADVLGNRHVVVVQDHEHVGVERAGVVQRFERLARGDRAIADDCDDASLLALRLGRERHADRCADRRARVADAERVVLAFEAARKRREAALVLDRLQSLAPPRQHLVRVRLVAHVPDQAVAGRVEDVVERNRELDSAEPGGEVAAHLADGLDQELAEFVGQRAEFGFRQLTQVGGRLDASEQRIKIRARHDGNFTRRASRSVRLTVSGQQPM